MRRLLVSAVLLIACAAPASAASWLELNFGLSGPRYDAPCRCAATAACSGRSRPSSPRRKRSTGRPSLEIVGIDRIRETAFRPWAAQAIPRRFCSGVARISDGSSRPIHYSINETGSWLGVSWGIEWCVVGLDRNWAYNPACRMARP